MVVAVTACAMEVPSEPPAVSGAPAAPRAATPRPTADASAAADDAVFGRWRRTPAHPTAEMTTATEAACRSLKPVGTLPMVVVDARGEGEVNAVFADARAAVVCHAALSAADVVETVDARPVAGYPASPPGARKLGVHDLRVIDSTTGARSVLVGQVGEEVARVAAQFDDATWSNASMAGGWYAMWWPGRDKALTVAAVNTRSEALDGFSP
jgi:hypothetical protein